MKKYYYAKIENEICVCMFHKSLKGDIFATLVSLEDFDKIREYSWNGTTGIRINTSILRTSIGRFILGLDVGVDRQKEVHYKNSMKWDNRNSNIYITGVNKSALKLKPPKPKLKQLNKKEESLLTIYAAIYDRCYDIENENFIDYGANGIKLYSYWYRDSSRFIEWALCNGYNLNKRLARRKGDKDFSPNNCYWI